MKPNKRLLCPRQRRGKPPSGFSWVDHRLVRDSHIEKCGPKALALYLFLVTVGDAEGLSYYGDEAISRRLRLGVGELAPAREEPDRAAMHSHGTPQSIQDYTSIYGELHGTLWTLGTIIRDYAEPLAAATTHPFSMDFHERTKRVKAAAEELIKSIDQARAVMHNLEWVERRIPSDSLPDDPSLCRILPLAGPHRADLTALFPEGG